MIKPIKVNDITKNINDLYLSAFPFEERIPDEMFKKMVADKWLNLIEYYDGDTFIGFTIYGTFDKYCYLLFFAINTNIRSKGYGSKIIEQFKKSFKDKIVILGIEEVTNENDLQDQKTRRFLFYKKNGFILNDFKIKMFNGLIFNAMSNKPIDMQDFSGLVDKTISNLIQIIK